jgi:hypothetical protein
VVHVDLSSESKALNVQSNRGVINRLAFSILIFVVASIGAGAFIFLSPLGQVSVNIRVESSSGGYSQLFFADSDSTFIEERSEKELVVKGDNFLRFAVNPIRRTLGDQLRWDPLNKPSDMSLSEMYVQAGFSRISVPFESIQPSIGMSGLMASDQGVDFAVETNDSQALIQFELQDVYRDHVRNVIIAALLFGLVVSASVFVAKQVSSRRSATDYPTIEEPKAPLWVNSLLVVLLAGIALMLFWVSQLQ